MNRFERHRKKYNRFSIAMPIMTIIAVGILISLSSFYEKSWSFDWSDIRVQVKDSVMAAKEDGFISSGVIGYAAQRPLQYDRRIWIMENANEAELQKLINYPDGTVKAIAYEGLLRNPEYKNKSALLINSFKEIEYPISYRSGCLGNNIYISKYLIENVLFLENSGPPIPKRIRNPFKLTKKDIKKILVEYKKNPNLSKNNVQI